MAHLYMIYLLKRMIFHSYLKVPYINIEPLCYGLCKHWNDKGTTFCFPSIIVTDGIRSNLHGLNSLETVQVVYVTSLFLCC